MTKCNLLTLLTGRLRFLTVILLLFIAKPAMSEVIPDAIDSGSRSIQNTSTIELTESNSVLRVSGRRNIVGAGNSARFVAQNNTAGKYGSFKIKASGSWTYVTNSALDFLREGQIVDDSFTVLASDGTSIGLQFRIQGTNDPATAGSAKVDLEESDKALTAGGTLPVVDIDSAAEFVAQRDIKGSYGTFNIDQAGKWTYVANSAFDELRSGQSYVDEFAVSTADGTATSVRITIYGTNDRATLGSANVELKETNVPLSASGQLTIRDVDSPEEFVPQRNVKGAYGVFDLDATGAWRYSTRDALDILTDGQRVTDSFPVNSSDGTASSVNIAIVGSNDPAIVKSASVTLEETNAPLETSGKLTIRDVDSPETFIAQSTVKGKYGTFDLDASGRWTYVADSAFDELNIGKSITDKFDVSSVDGSKAAVTITINGTNDPPVLSADNIEIEEGDKPVEMSGKLTISDPDDPASFVTQSGSIDGDYGKFNIRASGEWSYVANSAFDELNQGQHVTDKFNVSSADGKATSVQVTILGRNDPAVLSSGKVDLVETNETLKASGKLSVRDVDNPEVFVAQRDVKGKYGVFSVDTNGAWRYATPGSPDFLAEGQLATDSFSVKSSDGTPTTVDITLHGTNDPAVLGSAAVVLDEGDEPLKPSGKLSIRDVDNPETYVPQNNVAGANGHFSVDAAGNWNYVANSAFDELNAGQSLRDSFTATSSDGTKTVVKITINGTNDPARMSAPKVDLDETNEALKTEGKLTIRDPDSPEVFVPQSEIRGKNGTFNLDKDGNWTYRADSPFDELNIGQVISDQFPIVSADGARTSVQINIHGTNDPAILSADSVDLDETNEPLRTSGTLTVSDVDNPEKFTVQRKFSGKTGSFSIDASGKWTYVANSAFDELNIGQSVGDIFSVTSSDGTPTSVAITIHGTNDPAILGSAKIDIDETNDPLKPAGTLTIRDVDSPETFVVQSDVKGNNGSFSIDATGKWTYVANSAFDELNVGQTRNDSFAVSSSDGTTTSVEISIHGSNDPAILSSAKVELDETNEPLKPTGALTIRDVDSPETFVLQKDAKGKYGSFSIDATGIWSYVAKSAFDEMNVGNSITDQFTVTSADGSKTNVQVTINGTNDPAVMSAPKIELDETNKPLKTAGTLTIRDPDDPEKFVAQKDVKGKNGTFSVTDNGKWKFTANSAFDELNIGQSLTDSFPVSSFDQTLTTVDVTINGTNDPAILGSAQVSLVETNEPLKAVGILTISDVDNPETFAVQSNFKGENGSFSIDATGKWAYVANSAYDELNVGKSLAETITVTSSDGTTTTVGVTIHGTNDPAILSAPDEHSLETNEPLKFSGKVEIRDVDSPETVAPQKNVKGRNGTFNIDADGQWTYVANSAFDELNIGRSVSDAFAVYSADNTSTYVKVTIDGTNDPAVLGSPRASLKETNSRLRTTGTVTIYDVDSPEVFKVQRKVKGKTGAFSIDAKGNWTYVSNSAYDWLGLDQSVSDSFAVESDDGTGSTVLVIINGTNDSASLSTTRVTLFETNSPRFTSGRIYDVDVDSPMLFVAQKDVNGKYGSFSIDPSGRWTYDAFSAFNELEVGQSVSDRFLIISRDGTPTSVQITIAGTEESKFDGGWVGAKLGINRSNLMGMKARNALAYGIEEGTSWKVGTLQLGIYGSLEFNNTASGPVNYGSTTFGMGAKLGYPFRNWLPYGKLGYARTNGSESALFIGAGHMYRSVGMEYKMDDHLSLSAEYTRSSGSTIFDGIDYQLINKNLTVGINFYFGVIEPHKPVPAPAPAPASKEKSSVPSNEIDYEQAPLAAPVPAPLVAPAFGPAPAPKAPPAVTPAFGPAPKAPPAVTPAFGPAPPEAPPGEITPSFGPAPAPKASEDAPITPSF